MADHKSEGEPAADVKSNGSMDAHQPGRPAGDGLADRNGDDVPPDAVGAHDDQGGGPEDRAPEPPDSAARDADPGNEI